MGGLWMPGAIVVKATTDGGSMTGEGGTFKMTWHTYEADPRSLSAKRGAERLNAAGNSLHLCFNPISGEFAQSVPSNRAGRGLKNLPGGVQTNRHGKINIQIEVIAYASAPWTKYITPAGKEGLRQILAWAKSLGIPPVWPNHAPVDYKASYPASHYPRPLGTWKTSSGHFSHSQVPENYHGDPGAIDITLWRLPEPAPEPKPEPKPTTTPTPAPFLIRRYMRVTDPLMHGTDILWVAKKLGLVSKTATGVAIYGPKMAAAVRSFQRAKHLTVDGVVGKQVATALGAGFRLS